MILPGQQITVVITEMDNGYTVIVNYPQTMSPITSRLPDRKVFTTSNGVHDFVKGVLSNNLPEKGDDSN